jgi:hypothetical protein
VLISSRGILKPKNERITTASHIRIITAKWTPIETRNQNIKLLW